ncbi:TPA: hypothetical protein ACHHNH_002798 [Staphylococcus aureus]
MDNINVLKLLEEEGVKLTDNIDEAIYIMADGRFISGMFDSGVRGEDHRIIECLFGDIDRDIEGFWDEALNRANLVMIVPETKTVLIKQGQNVTDKQLDVIDKLGKTNYRIDYF